MLGGVRTCTSDSNNTWIMYYYITSTFRVRDGTSFKRGNYWPGELCTKYPRTAHLITSYVHATSDGETQTTVCLAAWPDTSTGSICTWFQFISRETKFKKIYIFVFWCTLHIICVSIIVLEDKWIIWRCFFQLWGYLGSDGIVIVNLKTTCKNSCYILGQSCVIWNHCIYKTSNTSPDIL